VTLFILDINKKSSKKQINKVIVAYLVLSAIAIIIDKIYDIFGHGVDSSAMTWMFLYPLLGGALFYFIIRFFIPHTIKFAGYRVFLNIYNSGIATMTVASFIKGVIEIAGTNSLYLEYYYMAGGLFIIVGLTIMLIMVINLDRVYV